MTTKPLLLLALLLPILTSAQVVTIRIVAPKVLTDRKAVLLTREREFAAIVHSISLGFDTTHLQMKRDLLPDLYQLQISRVKGALTFFFEAGTEIIIDTSDVAKSVVNHSKSDSEWRTFRDRIQKPSDKRLDTYVKEEGRARKMARADSAAYWLAKQNSERQDFTQSVKTFILANPGSYVSLYLLKANWYALKNDGLFEKLDASLASHRNYHFLKTKAAGAKPRASG